MICSWTWHLCGPFELTGILRHLLPCLADCDVLIILILKCLTIDHLCLQQMSRDAYMGRADRARERLQNNRLHSIMAIPILASEENASAIKQYTQSIRPDKYRKTDDAIDNLRAQIATVKGKATRSAQSKIPDDTLSRWSRIGLDDTPGTLHIVGVMQVTNGVVDMNSGEAGGLRFFMEEDEEVRLWSCRSSPGVSFPRCHQPSLQALSSCCQAICDRGFLIGGVTGSISICSWPAQQPVSSPLMPTLSV